MTTLLTDDELVALSVDREQAWPTALPTVPSQSTSALFAAANRGRRSLAVRGLLEELATGKSPLASNIDDFLRATRLTGATICPTGRPDLVAGGGIVLAAPLGARDWICDTFTANGVHRFDRCSSGVALERVLGLAHKVFAEGVTDLGSAAEMGIAISSQDHSGAKAIVTKGSIVEAVPGAGSTFTVTATYTQLDLELVARLVGIPATADNAVPTD